MFTKLFSSITTSSIWNEDNNTRILWVTMLAMSNKDGYVSASVGGLAHEARISKDDCEKSLQVLSSPDDDSRSKEFDGRRIEVVDGGFQLLNHGKYRAMRSEEERKEYMKSYMAEYRRTKTVNNSVNNVSVCKPALTAVNRRKPPLAQAEAEAEADKEEFTIPEKMLSNLQFNETWIKWMEYRKKKKACKDWGALWRNQLALMVEWGADWSIQSMKNSMANDWQGIFPPKDGQIIKKIQNKTFNNI